MTTISEAVDRAREGWEAPLKARVAELESALAECLEVLTWPSIGTYDMDNPDWYAQVDSAVAKARDALHKKA